MDLRHTGSNKILEVQSESVNIVIKSKNPHPNLTNESIGDQKSLVKVSGLGVQAVGCHPSVAWRLLFPEKNADLQKIREGMEYLDCPQTLVSWALKARGDNCLSLFGYVGQLSTPLA